MFKKLFLSGLFLILILSTLPSFAEEKMLFAVDLIRHGDRAPLTTLPCDPVAWKEAPGELTPEGMQQEFLLGKKLRQKYVYGYHLLDENYDAKTIYVRSTQTNRSLMSAESFLLGLYPLGTGPFLQQDQTPALPMAYQPIPINAIPIEDDDLLIVKPSKNVYFLAKNFIASYLWWHEKSQLLKTKIERWSVLSGFPIHNVLQLDALSDDLYIRHLHHLPFPKGITQQDFADMMALDDEYYVHRFNQPGVSSPVGHRFLKFIVNNMEDVVAKKSPLKYVLFSGHDASIRAVMTTLGAPLKEFPPYASDLNFALFEKNAQYEVRVSYNDQPVNISFCGDYSCSLAQFHALVFS